jgi:membrane protein YdbS with pleckstrin-like domain
MEFYLYLNGARRGPLTEERVRALLVDGVLVGSDLASEQPDAGWKPLAEFRRFEIADNVVAPAGQSPPPIKSASDGTLPASITPTRVFVPAAGPAPSLSPLTPDALGPYARSTLAPDETAFYKTSLHWIIFARFAGMALLAFLFLAMPFAIGVQALTGSQLGWFILPFPAFIMLPPTLAFASSEVVLTDRRVLIKTGIIHRQTVEMFVSKMESVGVEQGFLGRMFDFGTVTIRGTGGSEEHFEAIARPLEFRSAVQRLQSTPAAL